MTKSLYRISLGSLLAVLLTFFAVPVHAETGRQLLLAQLVPGDYKNGKVRVVKLAQAVAVAIPSHEKQAPEIVATAISLAEHCEDIEVIIRSGIAALGTDPSESLVLEILDQAYRASPVDCTRFVVSSFLDAAPQFASSITDAAASLGASLGSAGGVAGPVFGSTSRPVPEPFVFPPSSVNGGIAPGEVTPVN